MLNAVTELLEVDWKLDISKIFFSKLRSTIGVKILEIRDTFQKNYFSEKLAYRFC